MSIFVVAALKKKKKKKGSSSQKVRKSITKTIASALTI